MYEISKETRLYITLIGVNLDVLALFFFIISLLKIYESINLSIIEISFAVIGSLMLLIGLKGFKRSSQKQIVFDGNKDLNPHSVEIKNIRDKIRVTKRSV